MEREFPEPSDRTGRSRPNHDFQCWLRSLGSGRTTLVSAAPPRATPPTAWSTYRRSSGPRRQAHSSARMCDPDGGCLRRAAELIPAYRRRRRPRSGRLGSPAGYRGATARSRAWSRPRHSGTRVITGWRPGQVFGDTSEMVGRRGQHRSCYARSLYLDGDRPTWCANAALK